MTNNITTFEQWNDYLDTLSFDDRCIEIKNKILSSPELDQISRNYFSDSFDYVYKKYKESKPLDVKLFKIYMEDVKGYKNIKMDEFIRIIILLSYCGFELTDIKES